VKAKWGLEPSGILDYLSLVGDSADNVPGVKGVGDKTALKLLGQYGSLDGIYAHADEIKGAIGNKIRDGKESAYFSKKLISLRYDVPLDVDFASFTTDNLDFSAAAARLVEYGAAAVAKSLASLGKGGAVPSEDSAGAPSDDSGNGLFSSPSPSADVPAAPGDAAAASGGGMDNARPLRKNEGSYRAVQELAGLTAFVDEILASPEKVAAFDTETDSLDSHAARLVGFSLCHTAGKGIYVPVILPGEMFAPPTVPKEDCLVQLARLFACPDLMLVMHNGKFDLEVLAANGYDKPLACKIADTMVAAWLLEPDAMGKTPYSLEYLSEKELALAGTEFNDIVPKGQTFADVPLEKAAPYGAEDADFTFQLWTLFKKRLSEQGLEGLYFDLEMKLLPVLARMEGAGIHIDKSALAAYKVELEKEIAGKEKEIFAEAGHEFNIASTKQLQQVLFEERKLVPGKKTRTGYSTDTSVLEELSERTADRLPKMILDYRGATKLLSTYVETLPTLADGNDRIHTSFLQTGTATGRLSSRDPNLQNIPVRDEAGRRIRSAFTAVPGTLLISADYSQIELVILAHLSGDQNLCRAFLDGVDVHRSTAALVYGVNPEDVTPDMRRFVKTVNFGIMYGMSAFRLAGELGITRTEAKDFIDRYFANYADVKKFIDRTVAEAHATGYSTTILGRRRQIRGINSRNKNEQQAAERIAVNTPIQGSAADIVKTAMVSLQAELDARGWNKDVHMLLQVHDELIFECPDDAQKLDELVVLIRDKMEHAAQLNIPLRVSIEHGKSWGEFH
ncbi:MAG: DNA polymerase I, partial [Treponema sp.]|nr:DNA polymerase I [Treponema sp.]